MADQMNAAANATSKKTGGPRLAGGQTSGLDMLADALRKGEQGGFTDRSESAGILFPFLAALGWRGTERELFEALPHFADDLDITEVRNILATLGFRTRERRLSRISELDDRLLPCIAADNEGHLKIVLGRTWDGFSVIDGVTGDASNETDVSGLSAAYVPVGEDSLEESLEAKAKKKKKKRWIATLVSRFKRPIRKLFWLSFVLNALALSTPIFVMALYDQVIPSRATDVWLGLVIGIGIALIFDLAIRVKRARMIAYMGGRLDYHITVSAFAKLLKLPASMTEGSPLGDQVAKLRDFDSLRDIFTGLLVTVVVDLPFVVITLIALALIGGPIVLVPLGMMLVYALTWLLVTPALKRSVTFGSKAKARRHSFLVEALSNLRTIKESAVEPIWVDRYKGFSADAALSHHKTAHISFLFQTLSQAIMTLSGLLTLSVGVMMALAGNLSMGALIASMALIWRILQPLQNLFLSLTRTEQLRVAVNQVDTLMSLDGEEGRRKQVAGVARTWQGGLRFNRVSLRYGRHAEPALLGVNFTLKPREFLAVTGGNGSGKSSLLRVLLGLQRPQAGQISLDGIDIRQIPPPELRTALAYVPQTTKLFHGTIAQNLRLGNPAASDQDIEAACDLAGVLDDIAALPRGFGTRVGDQNVWQINTGFLQKLALARAYAMDAPVLLLDEPANALDDEGDQKLVQALKSLQYSKTIVMVSHRPSHIRLADRVLVLRRGSVADFGPPSEVMD